MSDNFESSLINLGELSKPATVLVEKISEAVGGVFKPYQIVRVAKAEAQADLMRDEMQVLWSKVLAGKANSPGTYSKRTVNFLSDLDKNDAESRSHTTALL